MSRVRKPRKKTPCGRCQGREWYKDSRGSRVCKHCQKARVNLRRRALQKDQSYRLWRNAKERARITGVPFTISVSDVQRVLSRSCPVFGKSWGPGRWSASLDRLRPSLGYTPSNIAVISMRANAIKSDATAQEVLQVYRWMKRERL